MADPDEILMSAEERKARIAASVRLPQDPARRTPRKSE